MSLLTSWIQQLIIAVMLATFLDLLLPNKTMQRYVRFVMGLVILTIILSPILTFLKSDWTPDQLFAEQSTVLTDGEQFLSPSEIEETVNALNEVQSDLISQNVSQQLEQLVMDEVERHFSVSVEDVSVVVNDEQIEQITLYVTTESQESSSEKTTSRIETVKPVIINLEARQYEQLDTSETRLVQKIRSWIAAHWKLNESKIDVKAVHMEG